MFEWREVDSSCIDALGFSVDSSDSLDRSNFQTRGTLRVCFASGEIYDYDEVPYNMFEDFAESHSVGRFYHKEIKGIYHAVNARYKDSFPFNDHDQMVRNVILNEDDEDYEFFKDLAEGTKEEERFVVINGVRDPEVVTESELFEIINANHLQTNLKVYRLGDQIIDW